MTEFHTYGIEWTEAAIEFFVDGESACIYRRTDDAEDQSEAAWPYDQPYFLILNIAVGGGLGGEMTLGMQAEPDAVLAPADMLHNVDLPAARPRIALPAGIRQHPDCGPGAASPREPRPHLKISVLPRMPARPFPLDPPYVPHENPCGEYVYTFEYHQDKKAPKAFLNFEGAFLIQDLSLA